jgi:hypothetical protein
MRTVDEILEAVYGTKTEAALALGVVRSAPWNWRKWGYFPRAIAFQIAKDAGAKGVRLEIAEIPVATVRAGAA